MDKALSDQLDKKANGADEVTFNSKKYARSGPKNATSKPGPWCEVKESMNLLKELLTSGKRAKRFDVNDWKKFFKQVDKLTPTQMKDVDYLLDRIQVVVDNEGDKISEKDAMNIAKQVAGHVNESIGGGEAAALAHYEDQTSELKEKLKTLDSRLKDHERAAIRKPNLHASGQIINVNKHLDNAIKALSTI